MIFKHEKFYTYIENSKKELTCNSNNWHIKDMYGQTGFTGKLLFVSSLWNNLNSLQRFHTIFVAVYRKVFKGSDFWKNKMKLRMVKLWILLSFFHICLLKSWK